LATGFWGIFAQRSEAKVPQKPGDQQPVKVLIYILFVFKVKVIVFLLIIVLYCAEVFK